MNRQNINIKLIVIFLAIIIVAFLAIIVANRISSVPVTTENRAQQTTPPSSSCNIAEGFCLWVAPDWNIPGQNNIKFHITAPGVNTTEGPNFDSAPPKDVERLDPVECPVGYEAGANETCYQIKFDYQENQTNNCHIELLWGDNDQVCYEKQLSCPDVVPSPTLSPTPSICPTEYLTPPPVDVLCPGCGCTNLWCGTDSSLCRRVYDNDFICYNQYCIRDSAQSYCTPLPTRSIPIWPTPTTTTTSTILGNLDSG